ncbi:MAG: putative peroxiredoxin bcp [Microgenomates bacterium OLB23]|nr:MAG: putative peroxiredoxin bcp [Microgenomates bacterium OLB23]
MKAPDFTLTDQNGKEHSLSSYAGSWLLLYFYPKDNTPGCTKEACAFRDMWIEYKKRGINVVGISKDSIQSHKKFAEGYKLPFTLLSDPSGETIMAFSAWGDKKFMGKLITGILRKSYLINTNGDIVKEYPHVTPDTHAEEILRDFDAMQ